MSKVQITAFTGEYYFLSNYCTCPITIDGLTYRSAEAAFQAAKCSDPIDRAAFCTVPPNVAKAIGRKIKLRDGWEKERDGIMADIIHAKFSQNPGFAQALIDTDDAAYTLQEGHEHGICCLEDAKAYTLKIRSGCEGGGNGVVYADGYLNYINSVCYAATTEPNMVICDDCSPAIRSRDYKDPNIVCYDARGNGDGMLSPTITGDHNSRITDYTSVVIEKIIRWIVRRLTPTECERLQGYPDGWTDLGEWIDSKGKPHKDADAPRYKALGNSIALPQWYYVLGGIADRLPDNATLGSLFDGIGGFPYVWAQLHAGCKELCVWASEIEEFPIAVTKKWFPEVEDGKLF